MNELITYISKIVPLDDDDLFYLNQNIREVFLSKGTSFVKAGDICKSIGYVQSGFLRNFYTVEIDEITTDIIRKGNFALAVGSFLSQTPSYETVEALSDATLLCLDYQVLNSLYEKESKWNILGKKIAEYSILCRDGRLQSLLYNNAEERYKKLMTERPEIMNNVPLHYIASYLGIKRETLSRIRSKITF